MEKNKKQIIIAVVVTVAVLSLVLGLYLGLPVEKSYVDYEVVGTSSLQTILKVNLPNQEKIGKEILAEVKRIDKLINPTSKYENSDIYRINNSTVGEVVKVDKTTIELLKTAYDVFEKTGGKYNPASYYLVDIWNFSAEKYDKTAEHTVPTSSEIDLGIRLANTFKDTKFILDTDGLQSIAEKSSTASFLIDTVKNTVTRQQKCFEKVDKNDENSLEVGAKLDLGGIAKGYAVERCYDIFAKHNVANGLVNLGGNVYTFNKEFKVAIENPFKAIDQKEDGDSKNLFGVLNVNNNSLSCSGVYERNYNIGDNFYHHIIDTSTGYPANINPTDSTKINENAIVMACVIGKNGAVCDAVATSLVLENTIENAVNFINNNYKDEISSVILITNNREYKIIGDINFIFNENLQGFTKLV